VRFRVDTSSSAAFLLRERKHTHTSYTSVPYVPPGTKAWFCVRADVVLCTGTVCESGRHGFVHRHCMQIMQMWFCVRVLYANQSDVVLCTGTVCESVRRGFVHGHCMRISQTWFCARALYANQSDFATTHDDPFHLNLQTLYPHRSVISPQLSAQHP
jgi:hypothetical protein